MRYWIWWNDLIQGPFEPDELTSLKSFSEELLVCMEDRQEWIPASRVADLSAAIEQLRARQAAPRVPPPPPPKRPPTITPLQGEFFSEPPGQERLLESEEDSKGPFAYYPVAGDSDLPQWSYLKGQATMPFHFSQQPASAISVIELPQPKSAPAPAPMPIQSAPQSRVERITMARQPVMRESPVPKLEETDFIPLSVLENIAPTVEESYEERKPQWLLWIVGVAFAMVVLGSAGYWLVDRANTRSAISEANRMEPPRPLVVREVRAIPVASPTPTELAKTKATESPSFLSSIFPKLKEMFFGSSSQERASKAQSENSVSSQQNSSGQNVAPAAGTARSGMQNVNQNDESINSQNIPTSPVSPLSPVSPGSSVSQEAQASNSSATSNSAPTPTSFSAAVRAGIARGIRSGIGIVANLVSGHFLNSTGADTSQAIPTVAVTGAALGAKSGVGIAGSPSAISSLSSAASRASQWGASERAQETQTHSEVENVVSQGIGTSQSPTEAARASATSNPATETATSTPAAVKTHKAKPNSLKTNLSKRVAAGHRAKHATAPSAFAATAESAAANTAVEEMFAGKGSAAGSPASSASSSSSVAKRISAQKAPAPATPAAPSATNPVPTVLPGVGALSQTVPSQGIDADTLTPPSLPKADPWKGKQNEAILLVQNKTLPKSKITIGNQARAILQEMHEKELLHAAETGERLYLPDKMAWAALQEEGSTYRVYLNFLSWQASGERVQSRSYQFTVDLKKKEVRTDDAAAQQDLLGQPAELTFKHNPMATDIESILGGVDTYNKHKVQLIIIKKNNRNRDDRKKIEAALATAQGKVSRAVLYFRKTYTEKALENIAKAYSFSDLLKG